ncbi:hypothetical protein E3P81_01413 [Wallemia ichthyophaga]|nr:hypothetical protein E3P97_01414 [Wallemia ichthyophaga]TIB05592.1 hypothetical protein E3P96_01113 [Wallemia ichthyophaga]TIB33964.1 hypothetical protein E3P85_01053 [Wallemia ichthyophaga]TIB48251.1 hypothetical protein E3P82_01412 [Wallemia ichthyophaga]TIB52395.1 hypothetical protein E3P81_01413 [Wallemia ichthyophaga]
MSNDLIILFVLILACLLAYRLTTNKSNVHKFTRINNSHLIFGNFLEALGMFDKKFPEWTEIYGPTFIFETLFRKQNVHTIDPLALDHILRKRSYSYPKTVGLRKSLDSLIGVGGMISSEGDYHKRLKKLMASPLNSPANLESFIPLMKGKGDQLVKVIEKLIGNERIKELDILPLIEELAGDNVGLTLFRLDLGLLPNPDDIHANNTSNIAKAVEHFSNSKGDASLAFFLQFVIPITGSLPTSTQRLNKKHLSEFKKTAEILYHNKLESLHESNEIGEDLNTENDILTLLIDSNLKQAKSEQLTKDQIISQITTFVIAGIDTSAVTINWILYALSTNQSTQLKLRHEIDTANIKHDTSPTLKSINSLEYLDAVVKEGLRLYGAVPNTIREASQDDVIPLKYPIKDRKTGELMDKIIVNKGQQILIPIHSYNKSSYNFDDGYVFKPERWIENPNQPILTFLDGSRMCIGAKLALLEIKLTLIHLITSFHFDFDEAYEVEARGRVTLHPSVKDSYNTTMMIWWLGSLVIAAIIALYIRRYPTNVNNIPRIPFSSYFFGHVKHLFDKCFGDCLIGWTNEYGYTYVLESILREPYIHTIDKSALNHVLQKNLHNYTKPPALQSVMRMVFGRDGIFISEGVQHKKLRKLMTPSFFTASNLQNFIPIIQQKSAELVDVFGRKDTVQFDVLQDLKNISTDIVGMIGFGFSFDLLNPIKKRDQRQIELHQALQNVVESTGSTSPFTALSLFISSLTIIPTKAFKLMTQAMNLFEQVGLDIMNEKEEAEKENEEIGEGSFQGKDVLSLLMKSNLSAELNPSDRLSTSEVVSQIATFLLAGTDTTSNAMAYMLHSLASNKRVQDKLRSEIIENALNMNESTSLNDVNSLPYLDMVIKETLRLNAPVPLTLRQAIKPDVIPLAHPVKDTKTGDMISQILVKPGQKVVIGIHSYNKSNLMWDKPLEFIPERYENDTHNPPYLSFIDGQRVCIGYKIAILEMKITTINLIKNFTFSLPDPPHTIVKIGRIVPTPWVGERMDLGNRLELQVNEYKL